MYLECDTRSTYYLPLKHLSRRLDKGPFKMASVENYEDCIFVFEPVGSTSSVNLRTTLSAPLLYEHSTETLALVIERNLSSQINTLGLLVGAIKNRKPRKRPKASFK